MSQILFIRERSRIKSFIYSSIVNGLVRVNRFSPESKKSRKAGINRVYSASEGKLAWGRGLEGEFIRARRSEVVGRFRLTMCITQETCPPRVKECDLIFGSRKNEAFAQRHD